MKFTYTVWDIGRAALHYVDKGLVQKSGFGGGWGWGRSTHPYNPE